MASCTEVERLFQAYIDNELGHSDTVILEHHVAECPACEVLLHRHQQACAELFEGFAEVRLQVDLSARVLEHLPEMEHNAAEIRALNSSAKRSAGHERNRWYWAAQMVPAAAVVILLVLAVTIVSQWPGAPSGDPDIIGVVTQR
ncbi:MAG TPA: hypothetical protein ENN80_11660, partial [Candidatus Hydrogenedentes bacterium]|nr:hypothetical protein [Candidatus Hydrogenedentota bacterium]